jgi:DNA-binding NtrC family response regulator
MRTLEIRANFYAKLLQQDYPGNVRELSNYVHRAVVLCGGAPLTADLLEHRPAEGALTKPLPAPDQPHIQAPASSIPFHEAKKHLIETFEREYLIAVLNECGGIIYRAAKLSGMSERGFHQKLRHYGIDGTGFRGGA